MTLPLPLPLSEVDYPPCWPDKHSLQVTASGCMLTDDKPGDMQVWIDDDRLLEVFRSWFDDAQDEFAVWMRADLGEAVDDMIGLGAEPEHLLDWALHLELLAAKLREAAK